MENRSLIIDRFKALGTQKEENKSVFEVTPVPLDEFLHSSDYLNVKKFSPTQYQCIRHGVNVYRDAENESLGWEPVRRVGELVSLWGKGCIFSDTKIQDAETGESYEVEKIRQLGKRCLVWSYDEKKRVLVKRRASVPWISGYGKIFKVVTLRGSFIKVFEGHRFMAVKRGSTYFNNGFQREFKSSSWQYLKDLEVGDKVLMAESPGVEKDLDIRDELIQIIGYLLGDGSFPCEKEAENLVDPFEGSAIFYSRRMELIDRYCSLIKSLYDIDCLVINKKLKEKFRNSDFYMAKLLKEATSKFHRAKIAEFNRALKVLGLFNINAHSKFVPDEFFKLSIRQIKVFLSAIWDTDGYISKCKRGTLDIGYDSVSESLVRGVSSFLNKLGIVNNVSCRDTAAQNGFVGRCWRLRIRDINNCNKFLSLIKPLVRSGELCEGSISDIQNIRWETIKSIEYVGEDYYYDLEVEGTQNYLAQGFINHNSGKDFITQVIFSRVVYLLQCLKNPQQYYEMHDVSSIDLLNMAYSAEQANQVFFKSFSDLVRSCKYLRKRAKILKNLIQFDKLITAYSGNSFEETFEGKSLILCVLDEISAFKTKQEVMQLTMRRLRAPRYSAESVYDMAKSSVESRFGNGLGKVISISFPRFKNDYISQLYTANKDDISVFASIGTTWDINPYKKRADFDDEFRKNPERAEGRYGANPSAVEGGYFRDKTLIGQAFPLWSEEKVPTTSDYIPVLKSWFKCKHSFSCSVHVDLGVRHDKAGIAVSHVSGIEKRVITNEEGEKTYNEYPVVEVDLLTSFIVPVNGEIDISTVRQFIVELISRGFNIAKFTMDSYQSFNILMDLAKLGIDTDLRSVDRNTDAYDCLKELIYDKRLHAYSYIRNVDLGVGMIQMNEILDELQNLIFDGRKIDHPMHSAKDLADALAGSVQGAVELGFASLEPGDIIEGEDRETGFSPNNIDNEYLAPFGEEYAL